MENNNIKYDDSFHQNNTYLGLDLGAYYHRTTSFRLWAPFAQKVSILFYKEGCGDNRIKEMTMKKDVYGTWVHEELEDVLGLYYTYQVTNQYNLLTSTYEVVDPYAKAVGVNGKRAMVVDLTKTSPEGFYERKGPKLDSATDVIIYELHIRDISMWKDSGIKHKGKYLGLTEVGTKSEEGELTGLSHIIDLGVTHVHLLPIFDYASIDESRLEDNEFNWGYDPLNYNAPEGSYSTNPYEGDVRIKELKLAIDALHQNGLGVIMDVVYNHTYTAHDSSFNRIVPNYYYRMKDNEFSDGSACGNETASEHPMMRKYMVDSLVYWAKEYNIDGFRFDLMALHDVDTMNEISRALHEINPDIIIYGEGWTGGDTPLHVEKRALKVNVSKLDNIAVFSDDIRDGIKGSVFEELEQGFVSGGNNLEETIKFGVVGGIQHPEIDYESVKYSKVPYAIHPTQVINYASAHDNLTLWDKLAISNKEDSIEDRIKMNLLSIGIVMTSQGIPFFQAGEEMLRSKEKEDGTYDENSYRSSDSINAIKWINKARYKEVYEYYKGLIQFRKLHSGLRMSDGDTVRKNLSFLPLDMKNVVGYMIEEDRMATGDSTLINTLAVIYNGNKEPIHIDLSMYHSTWDIYASGKLVDSNPIKTVDGGRIEIEGISMMILGYKVN